MLVFGLEQTKSFQLPPPKKKKCSPTSISSGRPLSLKWRRWKTEWTWKTDLHLWGEKKISKPLPNSEPGARRKWWKGENVSIFHLKFEFWTVDYAISIFFPPWPDFSGVWTLLRSAINNLNSISYKISCRQAINPVIAVALTCEFPGLRKSSTLDIEQFPSLHLATGTCFLLVSSHRRLTLILDAHWKHGLFGRHFTSTATSCQSSHYRSVMEQGA